MPIRRLTPGDEPVLRQLAEQGADFDLAERPVEVTPLSPEDAAAYLADPSVLHWVFESEGQIQGTLQCQLVRKCAGNAREVLLYEIGVRSARRRRGIGRELIQTMLAWMAENQISEAWVLGDNPEAISFYEACGFHVSEDMAVYLTLER